MVVIVVGSCLRAGLIVVVVVGVIIVVVEVVGIVVVVVVIGVGIAEVSIWIVRKVGRLDGAGICGKAVHKGEEFGK